eukprot:TRINITY_DN1506_c0_g1_i1.p1 TRINITY_DN1506_c0_g1~~TRINITY_DN1506_c0_g1_i1.p1  ORF type:complete len:1128 (+),score=190.93 TRINITY_DN1506_c0_g1_i1:577-3960(+)
MGREGARSAGVLLILLVAIGGATCQSDEALLYSPACTNFPYSNGPPLGWLNWSNGAAWGGAPVPGVGAAINAVATIPCDQGIILDVPLLQLDKLIVNGWLKVTAAGPFQVMVNFVNIGGRLTIGTDQSPYAGKITFNLTDGGYQYTVSQGVISDNIGTKAFGVIGGKVEMNGMYGGQAAWTTLTATAPVGATTITVQGNVAAWPVGGEIAIASTDFDYKQAERRKITAISLGGTSARRTTTISLSAPLVYMHWGDPLETGIPGVYFNESAEVALLTRAIVIQGQPDPVKPLIGGHFIVLHTPQQQLIQGVELVNMGQQGLLGRYPMHFHMSQDLTGSYAKKLAIHDCNQRCVVVHGTWNALVDGNVAVQTKGHCYFIEDGIEFGNTFSYNLGFYQESVVNVIPSSGATESDDAPSTFWISNPSNNYIGNVAGGCSDSGWWFQLAGGVQGPSKELVQAASMYPKFMPLLTFSGNVAHSNMRAGLRTYSDGFRPRLNGGANFDNSPINAPNTTVTIANFRAYKNAMDGMFVHESDSIIIDGCMLADNVVVGIELHQVQAITVQNCIILGETANIGNPSQCSNSGNGYANCKAITGCAFPVTSPANQRSAGAGQTQRTYPQFGILLDQDEYPSHGLTSLGYSQGPPIPQHIRNVTFGFFNNACRVAAAITANGHTQNALFTASHSSSQLTFVDDSPRFYMAPRNLGILGFETAGDAGPTSALYVFHDEDGSLIGGYDSGYVVTNSAALLPFGMGSCGQLNGNYGFSCPFTCYRTVAFAFSGSAPATVYVTREADGLTLNYTSGYGTPFLNLLANSIYIITFSTTPASFSLWYADPEGCQGSVILQFPPPPGGQTHWTATGSVWQPCAGSIINSMANIQISTLCTDTPIFQVVMGGTTSNSAMISVSAGPAVCGQATCGIIAAGARWSYNDNAARLPSPGWSFPSYDVSSWKTGYAMFGYGSTDVVTPIQTVSTTGGVTWYFRTSFNYYSVKCAQSLQLGILVNDGVLVYMNGMEIYRAKLPSGNVTATTLAQGNGQDKVTPSMTVGTIPIANANLIPGRNILAVEVHAHSTTAWNIRFNMWLILTTGSCNAATLYNKKTVTKLWGRKETPKTLRRFRLASMARRLKQTNA